MGGGASREVETKIDLSATSFRKLLALCTVTGEVELLNVYYDCDDAIAGRAGSLRLRYIVGAAPLMTLKLPESQSGGIRVSLELEAPFARRLPPRTLTTEQVPAALRSRLEGLCAGPLHRLGSMRTRRCAARLPGGVQAELDEVRLPGGQRFYEVEIESDDRALHAAAVAAVRAAAPDSRFSTRGKFSRFLEARRAADR